MWKEGEWTAMGPQAKALGPPPLISVLTTEKASALISHPIPGYA